jgi:putative transposase
LKEQQARFDEFRRCFDQERPHEALAFRTPDSVYVASTRAYPLVLPKIADGDEFDVPTVRKEGDIKWQGVNIFININELLRHEPVGLRQIEDDLFEVYFGATLLGEIDGYRKTFIGRKVGDGRCLG